MRENSDLKSIYNKAYSDGKSYAGDKSSFFTFPTDDVTAYVLQQVEFTGRRVLEVGCGTGETAIAIARSGADSILGVDYSSEAIDGCKQKHAAANLSFEVRDYRDISETFDIVVLQEVIEHLDQPEHAILQLMNRVTDNGILVITCPNFANLRGHIWMTLQILFDVPMSLTDIHFFCPFDFLEMATRLGLSLEWSTFAHDRVTGEKLITDMRKRLTNALRDAKLDNSKVDLLMGWISKVTGLDNEVTRYNGGKGFYVFHRGTERPTHMLKSHI